MRGISGLSRSRPIITNNSVITPIRPKTSLTRTRPERKTPVVSMSVPEVKILHSAKEGINKLEELVQHVVAENSVVPQIRSALGPTVSRLLSSFPLFFSDCVDYFGTLNNVSKTAATNQVVSTFALKDSLGEFSSAWTQLSDLVDKFSDVNPPPHIEEIAVKVKSIQSTLDLIHKANQRQKLPSPLVEKSINCNQSLCQRLYDNIEGLFSQPCFPHFDTDMCTAYKNDVKSFVEVVTSAFSNDFVLSGQRLQELLKIRTNVLADCNDIISILSASFYFTDEMKEIQKMKNQINDSIDPILKQISEPFTVVKPATQEKVKVEIEPINKKRKLKRQMSTLQTAVEVYPKVDQFLNIVLPELMPDIKMSLDINDNIETLVNSIKEMKTMVATSEGIAKHQLKRYEVLKQKTVEDIAICNNSIKATKLLVKTKEEENQNLKQKIWLLEKKIEDLTKENEEKEKEVTKLNLRGDPEVLRCGLRTILKTNPEESNSDTELLIGLNNYIKKVSKCDLCPEKDRVIKNLENGISGILHQRGSETSEEKIEAIKYRLDVLQQNLAKKEAELNELNNVISFTYAKIHKTQPPPGMDPKEVLTFISNRNVSRSSSRVSLQIRPPYADDLTEISRLMSDVLGESSETRLQFCLSQDHQTLFEQISDAVKNQIKDISKKISDLEEENRKANEETENEKEKMKTFKEDIAKAFGVEVSDNLIEECHEAAVAWKNPYEKKTDDSIEEKKKAESRINSLYSRMRGIVRSKKQPVEGNEEKFNDIHEMLDDLQDEHESIEKRIDDITKSNMRFRKAILYVFEEWQRVVDIPEFDVNLASDEEIINLIERFAKMAPLPNT